MTDEDRSQSSEEKVRAHRESLWQQGLRPIQIWVPDVRLPGFQTEAHRQSPADRYGGARADTALP